MPDPTRYKMNYRPRKYGAEGSVVEIARVSYSSWASDAVVVRARTQGDQITYSVVCLNELLEQTYVFARKSSSKPLTLAELVDLIDSAALEGYSDGHPGLVLGAVKDNYADGSDHLSLVNFVDAGSRIYKQLSAWYDEAVQEWADAITAEFEDEELEIDRQEAEAHAEAEAEIRSLTVMISDPATPPEQLPGLESRRRVAGWRSRMRIARRNDPIYKSGLRVTFGVPNALEEPAAADVNASNENGRQGLFELAERILQKAADQVPVVDDD